MLTTRKESNSSNRTNRLIYNGLRAFGPSWGQKRGANLASGDFKKTYHSVLVNYNFVFVARKIDLSWNFVGGGGIVMIKLVKFRPRLKFDRFRSERNFSN